nr:hypothetical transcript [Hymenolepis microstoma]
MSKNSPKTKLPITEYVDPEERFCYGIASENENTAARSLKSENPAPARTEPGIVGKTGHLIGALGSGLISGATGAVSLGASVVCSGVSVGTNVVSGALSYIHFPRFGSAAQTDTVIPSDVPKSMESDEDITPLPPKIVKSPSAIEALHDRIVPEYPHCERLHGNLVKPECSHQSFVYSGVRNVLESTEAAGSDGKKVEPGSNSDQLTSPGTLFAIVAVFVVVGTYAVYSTNPRYHA